MDGAHPRAVEAAGPVAVRPLSAADVEPHRALRLAALRTAPEAFGSAHGRKAAGPLARHAYSRERADGQISRHMSHTGE